MNFSIIGAMERLRKWGPLVAWCALIFAASHVPHFDAVHRLGDPDGAVYDYPLRKLLHLTEYAVLYLLAARAMGSPLRALIFSVAYACSDEWHQNFVAGREGKLTDVVIDACGAVLGWVYRRNRTH